MVTEKQILDYVLDNTTMGALVKNIPEEYIDFIHSFLSIPFPLEANRDREWMIYLYIVDALKWYVKYESEDSAAMDTAAALLELLDTAFDHKPEYRVERFYQS